MRLPNGTVLPSGLLSYDSARDLAAFNKTYSNTALRAGIIVRKFEVDDPGNISKIAPEYDVLVVERNENQGITTLRYKNCLSIDGLGSIADYFEKKFRSQSSKDKDKIGEDFAGQDGAAVYLLCLDGQSAKGVILGGLHHPDRKSKLDKEKVLAGEINGVQITVKDDGSANLTFRGATDNQGKPKDTSQGDTAIDIEKDGSFQVKHKGVTQRAQKDGKYSVTSEDSQTFTAKKEISMKTEDKFLLDATSDAEMKMAKLLIAAQGSATMTAQALSIQTHGEGNMKTSIFNLEASSLIKMKGGQIVLDGLIFLGGQGGTPSLKLTTKYLGTGNLGAPVISSAIGPFSNKVFIT